MAAIPDISMNILPILSVLVLTSAPMNQSRSATSVPAVKTEAVARSGIPALLHESGQWSSVADTSGDSREVRARQRDGLSSADLKARESRTMGILALGTIGLGLLLPVLFAGAVPLGILAIVKGARARKEGSVRPDGRVMGIVALSLLLLGAIVVVGFLVTAGFF